MSFTTPGLISTVQSLQQTAIQQEQKVVATTDIASSLTAPNGLNIPSGSQIESLFSKLPAITAITSQASQLLSNPTQSVSSLSGFLNSAVGTAQQLAGSVTSVVGAAAGISSLLPDSIGSSTLSMITQNLSDASQFLVGQNFTAVPEFNVSKYSASANSLVFPTNLNIEDGVRFSVGFKQWSNNNIGSTEMNYSDTTDVITLPIPVNLVEQYNVSLSQFNPGPLWNVIAGSINDIASGVSSTAKSLMSGNFGDAAGNLFNMGEQLGSTIYEKGFGDLDARSMAQLALYYNAYNGNISNFAGSALNAWTGSIVNPHTTATFKGVPLRQHQFNWVLAPKSQSESEILKNIYYKIKTHMLPTASTVGGSSSYKILDYPMIAYPKLIAGGSGGPGFDRNQLYGFKPCFISGVSINHAGGGTPSFFYDDKSPTVYILSIAFAEIEMWYNDQSNLVVSPNNLAPTNPIDDLNVLPISSLTSGL